MQKHTGADASDVAVTLSHCHFAGCLQLLEILEISWNLNGPPGNFCVMIENFYVMIDCIGIRS